jgi:hypothetical protein
MDAAVLPNLRRQYRPPPASCLAYNFGNFGRTLAMPKAANPLDKSVDITLSNNLRGAGASSGSRSVRAIPPFKSSGKVYRRLRLDSNSNFSAGGFATADAVLGDIIGNSLDSGICSFTAGGGGGLGSWYNGVNPGGGPPGIQVGDWIVSPIHLDTGDYWIAYQTAAGSLNTTGITTQAPRQQRRPAQSRRRP